jgi:hypothetical protein
VRSLRCLQSLQQLIKRFVVLCRVILPAPEIADDFADYICFAFVLPFVEDVIVNAYGEQALDVPLQFISFPILLPFALQAQSPCRRAT